MCARKAKKRLEPPETIFRRKLTVENRKTPGMMVKAERMAQGSMADYCVKYVHASQLDPRHLDTCLRTLFGSGSCLLRFVDETRQPLDEYGTLWIHFGGYDDLDDRLEEAQAEVIMALLEAQMEEKENQLDKTMAFIQTCVNLRSTQRSAFSRLAPATVNALKRSMQNARPDNSKVLHETMRQMSEMRDKEQQRILKQRADVAQQLQTALAPIMAEMQAALQAQEVECETQSDPISQEPPFPPGDCSPPIVRLPLQRLNINGILHGLGKIQGKEEDDQ